MREVLGLRAKIPLPISYFKLDEAVHLYGEFQHWRKSRRDEKVRRFAALIGRPDFVMVYCAVALQPHQTMRHYVGGPATDRARHPYNQPYLLAAFGVLMNIAFEAKNRKAAEPVEVVFDEQEVFKDDVKFQYRLLSKNAPPYLKPFVPSEPIFRDDKNFVVLQAADLVMGMSRLHAELKADKFPTFDWKHLKASGAAKIYGAEELADHTAIHLSRQTGIPRKVIDAQIRRPIASDSSDDS